MENWFVPYETSALPAAQKVLILAPHPDDEVFGCGGAAALLQQSGASVDVVVLTDGAGYASDDQRQAITRTRQAETNAALAVLGIKPAQFWAIPDRSLVLDDAWHQRLQAQLRGVDLVFAPSVSEVHPDHAATGRAILWAAQSLAQQNQQPPEILFYEVGAPLAPNFLLDISLVWPQKKRAMLCFESQQASQDYARHIEGLNTFRTYSLNSLVTHAEAYRRVSAADLTEQATALLDRACAWDASLLNKVEADYERLQADWSVQRAAWGKETIRITNEKNAAIADWSQRFNQLTTQSQEQATQHQQEVKQLKSSILSLTSEYAALLAMHQSLLDSRSWRWTRPLRWLSKRLRPSSPP